MISLKQTLTATVALLLAVGTHGALNADVVTLVDNNTLGYYNAGLGTLLNGTDPAFPAAGDPVLDPAEPDWSAAAVQLGGWLSVAPNLTTPGATWSAAPVAIPLTWTVGSETAIVYEIMAGGGGLTDVLLSVGVDNGILAWLNGVYVGGALRPGGASLGEHQFSLGALSAGPHYLQLIREDHGGVTGFAIEVTGERRLPGPVPDAGASAMLLGLGLGGMGLLRRRLK